MSPEETKIKLLESEEFVISELQKVQTLFALKRVIRYDHRRIHEEDTESVAEHIFGMHCLIDYFLPLENPKQNCDYAKIHLMANYHDIDEIETGDTIGYRKSKEDEENELTASVRVIKKLPVVMQLQIRDLLTEYKKQESFEAKYVKAIDKVEPIFHLYNQSGKKTLNHLKTTKYQHDSIKYPYIKDFPIIKRFTNVMTEQFQKEGFYYPES